MAALTVSASSLVSLSVELTVPRVLVLLLGATSLWLMGRKMEIKGSRPYADRTTSHGSISDIYFDAAIATLIGLIVGIAFVSWTGSTPMTRLSTGPDNIGLLSASQVLTEGYTVNSIESTAFNSIDPTKQFSTLDDDRLIYRVPSYKVQIGGEFLNLGLRWGTTAFVAFNAMLFNQPPGLVIGMMMIFVPIILTTQLLRLFHHLKIDRKLRLLGSLMLFANPLLLRVVIEGGLQQLYATVFFFELLISFVVGNQVLSSGSSRLLLFTCGFVVYSDLGIILTPIFLGLIILEKFEKSDHKNVRFSHLHKRLLCRLLSGSYSILTLGFFFRFATYIPRRVADSSIGGWPQPPDPTLFQMLGFLSPYSSKWQASENVFDTRFTAALIMSEVFLLSIGIIRFHKVTKFKEFLLHGSAVIATGAGVLFVYFLVILKVRLVDGSHNYQIFKAASYALPFVIPGAIYIWSKIEPKTKSLRIGTSVAIFGLLAYSLGTWVGELPQRTSTFSILAVSKSQELTLERISEFNTIGTSTLKYASAVSLTDAGVLRRGGGVEQDMTTVRERELLFVIDLDLCDPSCKEKIGELDKSYQWGDLVGIPLGKSKLYEEDFTKVHQKMESLGFDIQTLWGINY